MFKIVDNCTFIHDVKVLTPVDGGYEEENLSTTFNYMSTDETDAFNLRTPEGTTAFLQAAVVTFNDLVDDKAAQVTCTPELRERLLIRPNIRSAVIAHYFDAVTRIKEGN
jgi:hypothetical protein